MTHLPPHLCLFVLISNQRSLPKQLTEKLLSPPLSEADMEVHRRQQVHGQRKEQRKFLSAQLNPPTKLIVIKIY